ncbi:hypothetical protein B0T26DRAFT_653537 [Lasiosphaeria miniovina]|uniref:JmjC domain-containing protein n=1 Tax=Lasiosphaeria miniovina TaxID=1954250 RepID=A0AA40A5T9_9PEZI|nr:uncharacterized protein B0T26DRAFT_653537 [Lasiosphaeria miniovina]KAK0709832.1 hypothetical protein B0T26DRAFT_653537 [Lasiosphaeria miniovina]
MLHTSCRCATRSARISALNPRASGGLRSLATAHEAFAPVDVAKFKYEAFDIKEPLVIRPNRPPPTQLENALAAAANVHHQTPPVNLPALTKWFTQASPSENGTPLLTPLWNKYHSLVLPFELVLPPAAEWATGSGSSRLSAFLSWLSESSGPLHKDMAAALRELVSSLPQAPYSDADTRFLRFDAPLALLDAGLQYNKASASPDQYIDQLYIAQAPLNTLPPDLQADVPTPDLVREAGNGDIYDSSIWIGLEPTYTPWHKDPNPNLFCQMCSSKLVRMLPPQRGAQVYDSVRAGLGYTRTLGFRGDEMMQGPERRALLESVWGDEVPSDMLEVLVNPQDVLFIPKRWWHSVKSVGSSGQLNGSVNWWFR